MKALSMVIPLLVGFALNEWSHSRRDRAAAVTALSADHRHRQIELLGELRGVVLEYGEVASAHLWAGWSALSENGVADVLELESLHEEQDRVAMQLFSLCAAVDDPWIRHRVDYLEERARCAAVTPGKEYLPGGGTRSSVSVVLSDDKDIQWSVILINNLIGDRLLALTGGRRLPSGPTTRTKDLTDAQIVRSSPGEVTIVTVRPRL